MPEWNRAGSFTRIVINGQTYNSLEAMPPDVRRQYDETIGKMMADRDGNGMPDVLEHPPEDPSQSNVMVATTSHRYIVNGREYERFEDLPAEICEAVSRGLPAGLQSDETRQHTLDIGSLLTSAAHPRGGVRIHFSVSNLLAFSLGLALAGVVALWIFRR